MTQAGVCLRRDTDATLTELTEQHRIRLKEEELGRLESVHMAETECAAPGLNTLEPECVTAHSRVSDVHTYTPLIKMETELGSTHIKNLVKSESLDDCTEPGCVTHLHPDQVKTEAEDGEYLKVEHIIDLQDVKCDQLKCESSESLVSDVRSTLVCGAAVDHKHQPEPRQGVGSAALNHHFNVKNENDQITIIHKSVISHKNRINSLSKNEKVERVNNSNPSLVNRNKGEIHQGEKPFNCAECEKCFKTKSHLNTHLRIHSGEKAYACSQCKKCFNTKSNLNTHLRIHTGEKPYKCEQCEKSFKTKSYLNSHQRMHTGEKPFKCNHCGNGFSHPNHLNTHMRTHSGEKPYKCHHCGNSFAQASHLNVHLRIHTGEKPYECDQCKKCFNSKSNLNAHLRIHSGEKPYKCEQCEKSFKTKPYLNSHQRMHTGAKPFKCIHCGNGFFQASHLNVHLRIHTGEKPYKCAQCEKLFRVKCDLSAHLRIHTGEKPYKCAQCERGFKTKSNLNTHMRMHTGEKATL